MRLDRMTIGAALGIAAFVVATPHGDNHCEGVTTVYVTILPSTNTTDLDVDASATDVYPIGQYPAIDTSAAAISSTSRAESVTTSTKHITSTVSQTMIITSTLIRVTPTETVDNGSSEVTIDPVGYASDGAENAQAASGGPKTFENLGPIVNTELNSRPYTSGISPYEPLGTSAVQVAASDSAESTESVVYVYQTITVIPLPYRPSPAVTVIPSTSTEVAFPEVDFSAAAAFTSSSATQSLDLVKSTLNSFAINSAASFGAVASSLATLPNTSSSAVVEGWNTTTCTQGAPKPGINTESTSSTQSGSSVTATSSGTRSAIFSYPAMSTITVVESSIGGNSSSMATFTIPLGNVPVPVTSDITGSSSISGAASSLGTLVPSSAPTSNHDFTSSSTIPSARSSPTTVILSASVGIPPESASTAMSMPALGTSSASDSQSSANASTVSSEASSSTGTTTAASSSAPIVSLGAPILTFSTSTISSLASSNLTIPASVTSAEASSALSSTFSVSATPTSCGLQGDFTLDFDDLPPLAAPSDTADPMPIFNPYHKFFFGPGFVVVPPPTDPYLPASGKLLLRYIPVIGGNNTGQVGNGYSQKSGCFNFNARGASLGCDSKGPQCDWEVSGLRYDFVTMVEEKVASQKLFTPSCPALVNCSLVPVTFDDSFKNLTSLLIKGTVAGSDKIWWMDSVDLSWYDNSCSKGLCRRQFRN